MAALIKLTYLVCFEVMADPQCPSLFGLNFNIGIFIGISISFGIGFGISFGISFGIGNSFSNGIAIGLGFSSFLVSEVVQWYRYQYWYWYRNRFIRFLIRNGTLARQNLSPLTIFEIKLPNFSSVRPRPK